MLERPLSVEAASSSMPTIMKPQETSDTVNLHLAKGTYAMQMDAREFDGACQEGTHQESTRKSEQFWPQNDPKDLVIQNRMADHIWQMRQQARQLVSGQDSDQSAYLSPELLHCI